MNFELFNPLIESQNQFTKIQVNSLDICEALTYLKTNTNFSFDRLNTIIGIDLGAEINKFELIYDLHSTHTGKKGRISVLLDRNSPHIQSVVKIFKSAYFDECEIYDMFGIKFDNNPNLKRLLMPKGWVGYPLRKDYEQIDKRLVWND